MQPSFGADADGPRKRRIRVPFRRARAAPEPTDWPQAPAAAAGFDGASGDGESFAGDAPDQLVVQHVERGSRHTLLLGGALSLDSVETLESAVRNLRSDGTTAVTLDLRGLVFIDSSGLWAITTVRKWCSQAMIEFSIVPGRESVQNVFELTGLSDLLPFQKDGASERGATDWE